ncbi:MAG: glucokinase [Alphaproteobacteria bacterium]|nr:MAG: glucokinase [Alphaproteobacteria bacterium]
MQIVAADIGGTHARFALAEIAGAARPKLGAMRKYRTREYKGIGAAWAQFARECGPLPRAAAIAVAAPIEGDTLTFMNSDWRIDRHGLAAELGVDRMTLLNDFGAVAHAVSIMPPEELVPLCGPGDLPAEGVVSVIGPGTGLGVAILDRRRGIEVIETEAAHVGFCPLDADEETVARSVAERYGRASVERVVSGPGLIDIYRALGGEGEWDATNAGALWEAAIEGRDSLAVRALALLVRSFGAAAGDIALAHGAMGVAITGSLAGRIAHLLRGPDFAARFTAKGRYRERMMRTPARLVTYAEPGLLGAAIAFQREFG